MAIVPGPCRSFPCSIALPATTRRRVYGYGEVTGFPTLNYENALRTWEAGLARRV